MNKILFSKHLIDGLIDCRNINEALNFLLANNVNINKAQLEELKENFQEKLNKADKLHLSLLELENIAGGGFFEFETGTLRYHKNLERTMSGRIASGLSDVQQSFETKKNVRFLRQIASTIGKAAGKGAEILRSHSQTEGRARDTFFLLSEGKLTLPFIEQDSISFIPINIRHFDDKAPSTDPVAPIPGGTHTPSGSRSSSPVHASESPKPGKHAKAVDPIKQQEETDRHVAESIAQTLEPRADHVTINFSATAEALSEVKEVDLKDMIAFNTAFREKLISDLNELPPQYHFIYLYRMAKLVGVGHSSYEVIIEVSRKYNVDLPERKAALAVEQYAELPAETFVHICLHLTDAKLHEFAEHYISDEGRKGNLVEALKLKDGDTAKEYVEKVSLVQSLSDVLDEKVADLCRQHSEYLCTHKGLLSQEGTLKQPSLGAALKEAQPLNTLAERLANLSFDDAQLMKTTTKINTYFSLLYQVHASIPEEIIELNDFLTEEITEKFRDSTKPEDVKDQIEKLEKIINEIYEKYKDKIERCQSAEEGVLKEFNCYGQYLKEKLEATDCSDGDVGLILICLDKIGGMVAKEDLETFLVNFISKNLGYREALSKVTEATEEVIKKKRELILKVLKLLKKPTGPVIEKINLTDIETGEQTDIEIKEQIRKWIRNFNFTIVVASKHKPVDELGKAIEFFTQEKQTARGNVQFTSDVTSKTFINNLCIILKKLDENHSEDLEGIDISIGQAFLEMSEKEKKEFFNDFIGNLQRFFNVYESEFTEEIRTFYNRVISDILDCARDFKTQQGKNWNLKENNRFDLIKLIIKKMGINKNSEGLIEKVNLLKNKDEISFDICRIETLLANRYSIDDLNLENYKDRLTNRPGFNRNLSELLCCVDDEIKIKDKNFAKAIEYIKRLEIYFTDVEKVRQILEEFTNEVSFLDIYLDIRVKYKIKLGEKGLAKLKSTIEELVSNLEGANVFDKFLEVDFDLKELDSILTIEDKAKRDEIIERAFLSILAGQNSQEIYEKLIDILEGISKNSQPTEQEKHIFVKIYQGLLIMENRAIDYVQNLTFDNARKLFEGWLNEQEQQELFVNIGGYSDFLQEEKATIVATQALLRAKKPYEAYQSERMKTAAERMQALLEAKKSYEAYQSMVEATKQVQGLLVGKRKSEEFEALRKEKREKFQLYDITESEQIDEAICLLDYLSSICGESKCTIEFVALLYKDCREEFLSTLSKTERKYTIRDLLSADEKEKGLAKLILYKTLCKKYEIEETNIESLNDVIKKVKEKNEETLKLMSFKICLKGIIGFEGLKYLNDEKISNFYMWLKDQIPNMDSMAFDDSFKKQLSDILASTLARCKIDETMESAKIVKEHNLEDSFFEVVTKLNNESELKVNLEKVIYNLESIKEQLKLYEKLYKIKTIALVSLGVIGVAGAFTGLAFGASYIPKLISKQNVPQQNDDDKNKEEDEE